MEINDEKTAHIKKINESLNWLIENNLWEDFREIIMKGVIKLAERIREKRRIKISSFDFKKNYSDVNAEKIKEEWEKEIDEIIDLSNRKDDDEYA